jgi:hypothetical protein
MKLKKLSRWDKTTPTVFIKKKKHSLDLENPRTPISQARVRLPLGRVWINPLLFIP